MPLATIETAITTFQSGQFVIIVDDADRENEGDLAIAADFVTPQAINFMAKEGRGLICVAMTGPMLDRLGLPLMVPPEANRSGFGTNFTLSVEARHGVTTGISAYDRAHTVQVLIGAASSRDDIATPGHMFPLRAHPGGVLARRGQTEASVDLARLAGLTPAAVICEVMAEDGHMARLPQLEKFAAQHELPLISVADLAAYRQCKEGSGQENGRFFHPSASQPGPPVSVTYVDTAQLPTPYGPFQTAAYRDSSGFEHLLLYQGELGGEPLLVRLHSECLTGDVMGSQRCDCGQQLQLALQRIAAAGRGALLYLRQEGRGIGLANKIRAYALQDQGLDTVEANLCLGFPSDARSYAVAAAMLRHQGVTAVRLLTNNPAKVTDLQQNGIEVVERLSHQVPPGPDNHHYLRTKAKRMAHLLEMTGWSTCG
jgi:3,4-dihydroxy 2-butanone 4-phosphate synthase / GTP cyclohydrolase II